jgi:hypothetical protein
MNQARKDHADGKRERAEALEAILDLLTSDRFGPQLLQESKMSVFVLCPEATEAPDKLARICSKPGQRELRNTLLLGVAIISLDRMLSDDPPKVIKTPSRVLALASGHSITIGSVVPKG